MNTKYNVGDVVPFVYFTYNGKDDKFKNAATEDYYFAFKNFKSFYPVVKMLTCRKVGEFDCEFVDEKGISFKLENESLRNVFVYNQVTPHDKFQNALITLDSIYDTNEKLSVVHLYGPFNKKQLNEEILKINSRTKIHRRIYKELIKQVELKSKKTVILEKTIDEVNYTKTVKHTLVKITLKDRELFISK